MEKVFGDNEKGSEEMNDKYQWNIKSIEIEEAIPPNTKNSFEENKPTKGYERHVAMRFKRNTFIYSARYSEIRQIISCLIEIYGITEVEKELGVKIR